MDFDRFTTFDLAEVRGQYGTSLLYGPNTLGGAVNLVTRKSARSLEGNARLGLTPVDGLSVDFGIANVGNKWYQLADGLPMPGCTWYVNLGYRFQRR